MAPNEAAPVINEIHYAPDLKTEAVEFVELFNPDAAPADMNGWALDGGVHVQFPPGTKLNSGAYLVIAENPGALRSKYGVADAIGPWTGRLSNQGEKVILRDGAGQAVNEVDYKPGFPWPTVGDAPGYSIELINPKLDNNLGGSWRASVSGSDSAVSGPTPGRRNAAYADNAPPQVRQVNHAPDQPGSGQLVLVTAKVTDPDGVASVALQYQAVDPGNYIELADAAYKTNWISVPMNDGGRDGDQVAGDSIYSAQIPAGLQVNRRLIRYRIEASDKLGDALTVPYPDDPQPNFAYFVYDGVPAWSGAIQPTSADPARQTPVIYGTNVMRRLPVYHLISKKTSVEQATWLERYGGSLYKWKGTLVYEGKVYDHIGFRARGGVWRYAMGKNMWKFDFNHGHDFAPRDNYGHKYSVGWTKLNLGACIQQGDYLHRGEQGMFESVGFKLFNLVGVEAPKTHFVQFRVVDDSLEASPTNQYQGDFWGLYLAVEQEDGRFLDEHDLPDGNFYKMEGGSGELNNLGQTGVMDKSDLNPFIDSYRNDVPPDEWWREHFSLDRYYSYQTVVQGIHHYDICYGKNYFYFLDPTTGLWSVHPWDLDLTWADNMYDPGCGGTDEFKDRVLTRPAFLTEFQNRIREIRDLLFNSDQAWRLMDEYAAMIHEPNGGLSVVDADRAMWDFNPVMANRNLVNSSKAGQGRFYQIAPSKDFPGMVALMKQYVITRGAFLDNLAADDAIPALPDIASAGPASFPTNALAFRTSAYRGASPFAGMIWRIGEITPTNAPPFEPTAPHHYEIETVWESPELTEFTSTLTVPSGVVQAGHTYRARVRTKDIAGRWSHWSEPVEFLATASSGVTDSDQDGMPDDWERAHGLNPNSAADAALDSDGDGLTNQQEYLAGTDPQDKTSGLKVTARRSGGGAPVLSFEAAAGRSYSLLGRDSLTSGTWQVLKTVPAATSSGSTEIADETAPLGGRRFYQLRIEPFR